MDNGFLSYPGSLFNLGFLFLTGSLNVLCIVYGHGDGPHGRFGKALRINHGQLFLLKHRREIVVIVPVAKLNLTLIPYPPDVSFFLLISAT